SWMLRVEDIRGHCGRIPGIPRLGWRGMPLSFAPEQPEGKRLEKPVYHVVLEGRTLGPYDRRTIVGMRVRKTLASDNVLVDPSGARLTVGELVRGQPPDPPFEPSRGEGSGSYSV